MIAPVIRILPRSKIFLPMPNVGSFAGGVRGNGAGVGDGVVGARGAGTSGTLGVGAGSIGVAVTGGNTGFFTGGGGKSAGVTRRSRVRPPKIPGSAKLIVTPNT